MSASNRYNRQIILPEIGEDGQYKLSKAKVLVIGAGGLGAAILPYLASAGVGEIGIIDDDFIEEAEYSIDETELKLYLIEYYIFSQLAYIYLLPQKKFP